MQANSKALFEIPVTEPSRLYPDLMSGKGSDRGEASAKAWLATLKEYLRFRIQRWLQEERGRQQRDFAQLSGVSTGHLSAILNGTPYSEECAMSFVDALGLKLDQALHDAAAWKKSEAARMNREPAEMRAAIEAFERAGKKITPEVRAVLMLELRESGDRSQREWAVLIPGLLVAARSPETMTKRIADGKEVENTTRPRARPVPSANNKTKNDR